MNRTFLFSGCLTILFIFIFGSSYAQWTKLNSGTSAELYSIHFISKDTGYCVGGNDASMLAGNGIILRTTNGGANWNIPYKDTTAVFRYVAADDDIISVFGMDKIGQYIHVQSRNKGMDWTKDTVTYNSTKPIYANHELYYIDGYTQTLQKRSASGFVQSLINNCVVFAANEAGTLSAICYSMTPGYEFVFARSSDAGSTWDSTPVNFNTITSNSISGSSLWAFGDTVVFLATYPAAAAYSIDAGNTWSDTVTVFPTWDAYMHSPYRATGATPNRVIMKSTDGLKTITRQDSVAERINRFYFADALNGYLCGENGMIYKTTNGGGETTGIALLQKHADIAVYPNPSNNMFTIKCSEPLRDASLSIYNIAGQRVMQVDKLAGNNVQVNSEELATGSYMYILTESGASIASGKIAVTK